jgi:PAS domain S-box-containing protein
VVRDFSDRRERDEKLRAKRSRLRPISTDTLIAGIVSGEFDRIPEANDAFLDLVGYTRDDLLSGRLQWPDLTPPEYFALDELAHEEGLRFGACAPFEKELIRKDGSRVQVLVATAVLKLAPFRWITFVQELRAFDQQPAGEETGEYKDEVVVLKNEFVEIVGRSAAMNRILGQIELVAPTNATV